ncbi:MAG TPA: redoxin family protein [Chitinophagaceae bacterium]|nr:redoxin family protein [Chitinophagaceae bacterium]
MTIGQSANAQENQTQSIEQLKAAIESNPADLAAHEAYLKASGFTKWGAAEDPDFIQQYKDWMQKYPKVAAIPYALGHAFASRESPKAKPFLLKAVEIDPTFDKAYFDLWIDTERWGDFDLATSYILKAKEADPNNADYAFYYANSFSNKDLRKYTELSLEVARKFPKTERGAQALYWLANRTPDSKKKIEYYELQKKNFPPDQFNWTSGGMSAYFDLLLKTDPDKAADLASYMAGLQSKNERDLKSWQQNEANAKHLANSLVLLNKGNANEALAALDKVVVPRYSGAKNYIMMLKCKALNAAGKPKDAYQLLLGAYAKEPDPDIKESLEAYGKELGKKPAKVYEDVWYIRDTASKVAPNFSLDNYFTKSKSNLSDFKGKVVLLTYWFPGCGPCRGEFPHFENVVKQFKGSKDFVYLGINIVAEQDDYVLPFMKSSGYSFIPLRDNDQWEKGPLNNRNAAPVNFLIDEKGKIIFSNFRTDADTESTLQAMISSMINRKKAA